MPSSVTVSTFEKYSVRDEFGWLVDKVDGKDSVVLVWCKKCAKHTDKILKDIRIRGQARQEVAKFACGTDSIKKFSLMRHLRGTAHRLASEFDAKDKGELEFGAKVGELEFDAKDGGESEFDAKNRGELEFDARGGGDNEQVAVSTSNQPEVDVNFTKSNFEAYLKLFRTAYKVASNGLPLSTYTPMVQIQEENGVELIKGCDSYQKCEEFIEWIAKEQRKVIQKIICNSGSFSVLSDGSHAGKTGNKKELIFSKVVHDGKPVYLCVGLQEMNVNGAATADNLKKSIDDVFLKELEVSRRHYTEALVSVAADGTAVNAEKESGLLVKLQKDDRPWLVGIDCISHRVELEVKDIICQNKGMEQILSFMVALYHDFEHSPELNQHLHTTAAEHGVQAHKMEKVHQTGFVGNQSLALHILLTNWILLIHSIEKFLSSGNCDAILCGVLETLKNCRFLALCCFLKQCLDTVTPLFLSLERMDILAYEIQYHLGKATSRLDDLLHEEQDLQAILGYCNFSLEGETLIQRIEKSGGEETTLHFGEMSNINEALDIVLAGRHQVLPKVKECLEERFSSFKHEVFTWMGWIDPCMWDDENPCSEVPLMLKLASHFQRDVKENTLKREWKDLKAFKKAFHSSLGTLPFWRKVFCFRREEFPSVCKLTELILSIGPSNNVVESGFSSLNFMLTDSKLGHQQMTDILLLRVNQSVFNEQELDNLLHNATRSFLSTKRKMSLEGPSIKRCKMEDLDCMANDEDEKEDDEDGGEMEGGEEEGFHELRCKIERNDDVGAV